MRSPCARPSPGLRTLQSHKVASRYHQAQKESQSEPLTLHQRGWGITLQYQSKSELFGPSKGCFRQPANANLMGQEELALQERKVQPRRSLMQVNHHCRMLLPPSRKVPRAVRVVRVVYVLALAGAVIALRVVGKSDMACKPIAPLSMK
jgi:hypothetical protein